MALVRNSHFTLASTYCRRGRLGFLVYQACGIHLMSIKVVEIPCLHFVVLSLILYEFVLSDSSLSWLGSCWTYWWAQQVIPSAFCRCSSQKILNVIHLSQPFYFSVLMGPKLREMDEIIEKIHLNMVQTQENNDLGRTLLVCAALFQLSGIICVYLMHPI